MTAKTKLKQWGIRLAVVAAASALYINWPALNGRECSGFTRTRDAYTIKYQTPLILKAVEEQRALAAAKGAFVPSAEVQTVLSKALGYLAQCTAERGLDRCMYIGPHPDWPLLEESKGGPPEEDADRFRYVIPAEEAGLEFNLRLRPAWRTGAEDHQLSISDKDSWHVGIDAFLTRCDETVQADELRVGKFTVY